MPAVVVCRRRDARHPFLATINRTLHATDSALPDLAAWEAAGRLVLLPVGGGDVWDWTDRLAPLGLREPHPYDAEAGVESAYRQRAAVAVNARPSCRAFLISKRNLENYLSPVAIQEARGVNVDFSDRDNVADVVTREVYEQSPEVPIWELCPVEPANAIANGSSIGSTRLPRNVCPPSACASPIVRATSPLGCGRR